MKKLFVLVLIPFAVSAQYSESKCTDLKNKCVIQLKQDREEILTWHDLYSKQVDAINEFASKGPETTLKYDGTDYIVTSKSEIQVWDKDAQRKIYPPKKVSVEKIEKYNFKIDDGRPHGYIGNVFKFGGGFFYNKADSKMNPDVMLMYELISFDLLFTKVQGISINAVLGLMHVGGSLGYQFVTTHWFRNTSLNIGYSYQYYTQSVEPFIALSLNF